ncbi:AAA domain protein [Methylocaldum marinum]|uniref:AAA domain protein n=1 Tax=Methylocaldum marinum TaxID=1432792 RepID=A0A250KMP4_9GAMM|nr:AAA family ATPase [Methylocaldum marinum]BBA32827.1 AAA domain protein [Methylocaldum marinum]
MRLSRVRIEQFKKFRQPIEIRDLEPGINLFTGPNETGKSTIVSAIRAAFFERHRSGSVEDLRPWGDASASPTVELEFSIGDKHFRLVKRFLGKKRCELQIGAQRLDSTDAEDHLAELLGFKYAGRGASGSEHWGIPGLLWIQQGSAHDLRDSVLNATDHLRIALNVSLGEVASSGGDSVLATVESARNELLTPAAGKPRGAYAEAMDQETALAKSITELDSEIAAYRQKVDTLASLRREHAADEAEKPWVSFREQERAAAEKLNAIKKVEESLAAEKLRATQTEARIKLLHGQLETFARQEKEFETRTAELESIRQRLEGASALVEDWQSKRGEAEQRHEAARETLRLARQADTRLSLTRALDGGRLKLKNAAEALARAETEQAALVELKRQAAVTEIKLKDLEQLREQQRQIRETQIRLETAATRLRFMLDQGRTIGIGDEPIAGTGERLLLETTRLTLPGLGQLEISPGGADLSQLRAEAKDLADRHDTLLQRIGLPSLEAAEDRHQTHARQLADIKTAEATLKALAPKGIEPLRTELAVQQARVQEIEQALSQLPPETGHAGALPAAAEAEAAEEVARQSLARINDSLQDARLAAGKAQTAFETATRELAAARAVVDDPQRPERVAAANRDLVDARAEQSALAATIEALTRQLAEARPDILKQDVERFRLSAEQLEKRFNVRRDQLMSLQVELQTAGAQGLEERRAELARDHAQIQRRVQELRRRADALDHLLKLMRDKRRALTQRLQAPLQKHLNRYLQLLFPGACLDIDENLSPGSLTRIGSNGSEPGEFEHLSFGAREQMGIISRLAYAGLLRDAGRPTLLILDDALVHSDEERLAQMKRVLFDAATRHQILLFTCHPAKWRDLGVGARSVEGFRAEA